MSPRRAHRGPAFEEPSVAEQVLELLRLYLPDIDADLRRVEERRQAPRPRRRATGPRHHRPRRPPRRPPYVPPSPPPDPEAAACYEELEVPYGSGFDRIRTAWRRLVREHHPDRRRDAEPTGGERIRRVNHAYSELKRRLRANEQHLP